MRLRHANNLTVFQDESGRIHGPFSMYLNFRFSNPHTRESVAVGLRILHVFFEAFGIDLASRALEGRCLLPSEIQRLGHLVYRPIEEIDRMNPRMISRFTEPSAERLPHDLAGSVEPNTAARRMDQGADFLSFYFENILQDRIRSAAMREELRARYDQAVRELKRWISGTKSSHHHQIQSLPIERYLAVIRAVFLTPEKLFKNLDESPSRTMMRDRAIALLGSEGLRPGAIGNLAIKNFQWRPGDAKGFLNIQDNTAKRKSRITTSTPVQKGIQSSGYNSEITMQLYPWTCIAIHEYITGERAAVTSRRLRNSSNGFLFVGEHGQPIQDRTTLSAVFRRLKSGLDALRLLDKAPDDPYCKSKKYPFTAYTLRHSAATFFYKAKLSELSMGTSSARKDADELTKDLMRERFGWSAASQMPELYAKRAISDAAYVNMREFFKSLLDDLKALRGTK